MRTSPFLPTIVKNHYQCLNTELELKHGFSQQALAIIRLISVFQVFISLSAVPVCKSANNARKVLNNAFLLMLFFKIGI